MRVGQDTPLYDERTLRLLPAPAAQPPQPPADRRFREDDRERRRGRPARRATRARSRGRRGTGSSSFVHERWQASVSYASGAAAPDTRQPVPRHPREVVVLVVVPDVERRDVQDAVVARRLLVRAVDEVVLLDPTGPERMEADREEEGRREEEQRLRSRGTRGRPRRTRPGPRCSRRPSRRRGRSPSGAAGARAGRTGRRGATAPSRAPSGRRGAPPSGSGDPRPVRRRPGRRGA